MRIIAGNLGGRNFDSPGSNRIHPMSEKMRGALFNALGDIKGLMVLDAYAGSGAMSFEAVSRGARSSLALDMDKDAYRAITDNIRKLGLDDRVTCLKRNVSGWSNNNLDKRFDIVLCDPPYDNIRRDQMQKLIRQLSSDGILVVSYPGKEIPPVFQDVSLMSNKTYGDSQLVFYKRD